MAASFAPPYHFIHSFVLGGSGHVIGMAREGTEGLCADSLLFHHHVLQVGSLYMYLAKTNFFTLLPSPSLALPTSPPYKHSWVCYQRWQILSLDSPCHKTEERYIYQGSRATYMTVSRQNEQEQSKIR